MHQSIGNLLILTKAYLLGYSQIWLTIPSEDYFTQVCLNDTNSQNDANH